MPLPDVIEIVPLVHPVTAEVAVPGSKSITNRALVLAALSGGKTALRGALWSEDTQVLVDALGRLGFDVQVESDPAEPCNRTLRVQGLGGRIPRFGTVETPLELFVGNAGTAARFLAALVCLGDGACRLDGVPRMRDRPQSELFQALRQLGYEIISPNDKLPAVVIGKGPRAARCQVSVAQSSQFASALLLAASTGGWTVDVAGENTEESPYVEMTRRLAMVFPTRGGTFAIEPDASSGSYFLAAGHLLQLRQSGEPARVTVPGWPSSGWQVDARLPRYLPLPKQVSRNHDLGDSIMTAIVLAPWAPHRVRFTDLARLRVQECERVAALRTELTRCGAQVVEEGDTLTVSPSKLHGATVETYDDHRMAMCFAILGLKVPGIRIKNPACVKKTFPNFFQKLADAPPRGLGATLFDPRTGQTLAPQDLFADRA
ncbi:MAG: 3-phosphoshikimate 1-carboxyvinyltransferase [Verrucomicrobiia bacterium]